MTNYDMADTSEIFHDADTDKTAIRIQHFTTGAYRKRVYFDTYNSNSVLSEFVSLDYDNFLRLADTVAEIAKTIRENG